MALTAKSGQRVTWTALQDTAIYPRIRIAPGALGTYIEAYEGSGGIDYVLWDDNQRTWAFDCKMQHVHDACDQSDRTLEAPSSDSDRIRKLTQSSADLERIPRSREPFGYID